MNLKRLGLATLTVAALALSGCAASASTPDSKSAGGNGETLVIYSTESTMPEFAERFEAETGITLQVISVSSGQGDARVAAEKANPQADVAILRLQPGRGQPRPVPPVRGSRRRVERR